MTWQTALQKQPLRFHHLAIVCRQTDAWPPQLGVRLPEGKWMNGLAPAKGAVMHGLDGGKTLRPHPRGNVTVERNALAKHLLMEARRLHPGIDFQFDAAIEVAFSLSVC